MIRLLTSLLLLTILTSGHAQVRNEVLIHNEFVSLEKGKLIRRKQLKILIASYDNRIGSFSIPFQENSEPKIDMASISDLNGKRLVSYKKKDFSESSYLDGVTFMSDQKLKNLSLLPNSFPYIFEIDYTIEASDYIDITQWSPVYYYSMPVKEAFLKVSLPSNLKVAVHYDSVFSYQKSEVGEFTNHAWTIQNVEPHIREVYAPPLKDLIPHVWVIPEEFHYGHTGQASSWQQFGSWLSTLNAGLEELTPTERIKIDQLTSGLTSKKEIISALYHHLQDNTRYVNVSFGIGGLKPYPAKYVCENQFGDCKALTIYMKSLLKHKGIESFYAPVYGGEQPEKVSPEIIASQFNHVILAVPMEKDTLWLENTASYLPTGYLGTFTQGRKALIVNNDYSGLVNTPALEPIDVKNESHYQVDLTDISDKSITFRKVFRGREFETLSYFIKEGRTSSIERYVAESITFKNAELLEKEVMSNRDSTNVEITGKVTPGTFVKSIASDMMISVPDLILPKIERTKDRNSVVRIDYPKMIENHFHFKLKDTDTVKSFFNYNEETDFGRYAVKSIIQDNVVSVTVSFQLNRTQIELSEYDKFFNFFERIHYAQAKNVIVLTR